MPQVFSLGPFARPPPPPSSLFGSSPSFFSGCSSFGLSGPPGFTTSASSAPVDPGAGASSSAPLCDSVGSGLGFAGASDPDDTFLYRSFDDASVKGESALGKAAFSRAFHEIVTLITGFFPCAKLPSSFSSKESIPWEDIWSFFQA